MLSPIAMTSFKFTCRKQMHVDCCHAQCWVSIPFYPWVLNTSRGTLRSLRADLSVRQHLHSSRRLRAHVKTRLANLNWPALIKHPLSKEPLAPAEGGCWHRAKSVGLFTFLSWKEHSKDDVRVSQETQIQTEGEMWIPEQKCMWASRNRDIGKISVEKLLQWLMCCLWWSWAGSGGCVCVCGGGVDGWGRIAALDMQVHCMCICWTITCFCSDSEAHR